jgi:hypothetical protein
MNTSQSLNETSPPFALSGPPVTVPTSGLHPAAVFVLAVLIGLVAAVPVGFLAGFVTYSGLAADCGSDGWCELGAALGGGAMGLLVGYVTYAVAGITAIFKWRAPGQRLVLALTQATAPLFLAVLLYGSALLGL